jgi:hypothetical protein
LKLSACIASYRVCPGFMPLTKESSNFILAIVKNKTYIKLTLSPHYLCKSCASVFWALFLY